MPSRAGIIDMIAVIWSRRAGGRLHTHFLAVYTPQSPGARPTHKTDERRMFVTPAYAQAAGGAGGGSFLTSMVPLILIFVIFYFL